MCRFLKFLHIWRNFRCLPMTYVEKSEILHIWHVFDVENVAIYAKFMLFSWKNQFCENLRTLSRNPFCCNLRTFVWRKIDPKLFFVEKKWQIWGLSLGRYGWIEGQFSKLLQVAPSWSLSLPRPKKSECTTNMKQRERHDTGNDALSAEIEIYSKVECKFVALYAHMSF